MELVQWTFCEFILENVVYSELKRRGYEVYIRKNFNTEVVFAAIAYDKNTEYY